MQGWVRIFIPSLVGGITFAGKGELTSEGMVQAIFLARELKGIELEALLGLLRAQSYLVLRFEPREEAMPFQKYEAHILDTSLTADALSCQFRVDSL